MRSIIVGVILSLLLTAASGTGAGDPRDSPVSCSSEGVVCAFSEDNLLDQVPGVATLDQCRELCLDMDTCQYISYFDENATPIAGFCQLFNTCENVNNCTNCYTENIDCRTCGTNVIGGLGDNVLDVIPYIESEMNCKELCLMNSTCTFYTYFLANDTLLHQNCFLLTEFAPPAQPCSTCITGPRGCSQPGGCSLAVGGEEQQALMVTSVGEAREIAVTGRGECNLTLLVVGGGGAFGYGGGAGSGYLEYRSLQVSAGTVLTATVGYQRQASSLAISGGETVMAQPGQDAPGNSNGGDGYSGGGGYGYDYGGDGGSDGGDGEDGSDYICGRGTGEDVSLYTFTTWSLTPGDGGQAYHGRYYGGGGGGVLVDGAGPQASQYQGQGYGGGSSGWSFYGEGLPGLILLEVN